MSVHKPVHVTIVRPYLKPSDFVGRLIGLAAGLFLQAWGVMVLVPVVFDWHPSYWQTLALVVMLSWFTPSATWADMWTKRGEKS